MKFSVAAPLVALLTAFILALLALLAGIKHNFLPDAHIVKISLKPDDQGSRSTVPHGGGRGKRTALQTRQLRNDSTILETRNATSLTNHSGSGTSTSSSTRPTSPTHGPAMTDTSSKSHFYYIDLQAGQPQMKLMDSAQCPFSSMDPSLVTGGNEHISDSGNSTSNTTGLDDLDDDLAALYDPYTLHFLTNCRLYLKNKTRTCSKPWDFKSHMLQMGFLKDDPQKNNSLLNRKAVNDDDSESTEDDLKRKVEKVREKVRKNRHGFSIVHLTGCVLVGLSFLCTAASFFILPALGKWISVGNLALATLATIFLLTSSIFTAVLAKKTQDRFRETGFLDGFDVNPARTLQAFV